MTTAICMCKDEADVIEQTVSHMLTQVDQVIVADNGSTDGTKEILEGLPITLLGDDDPAYYQSRKMTELGSLVAIGDWVVPFDADEIWLSPHGRIGDVLRVRAYDIVTAPIFNYVATGTDPDGPPVERLQWHFREPLLLPKVACRASGGLTIHAGNHGASYRDRDPEIVDGLLEVHHFPYRSEEQFVRKVRNGAAAYALTDLPRSTGLHWREYGENLEANGPEALRAWFREHFFEEDPESNPDLIHDPVSLSLGDPVVPTASAPGSG